MLTQRQENFATNLFRGKTQRQAWIDAGYSSKYSFALIDTHACNLAKTDKIKTRLLELRKKAEDAAINTVVDRKKILTQIERATIGDFVDEHGNLDIKDKAKLNNSAVQEINTIRTKAGGIRTMIKLRDPVGAISEHNKMEGVYQPEGNTVNNNIQIIVVSSIPRPQASQLAEAIDSTVKELPPGG